MEPSRLDKFVGAVKKLIRPMFCAFAIITASFCVAKGEITGKEVLAFMMFIAGHYFGERSALKDPKNGENG